MIQPDQLKKIGRAATQCLACGAPLQDVGRHPSALREPSARDAEDDAAFQREDFCPDCWRQIGREGYLSFWLARREPPRVSTRLTRRRRNETLLGYFVRLDEALRADRGAGSGGAGSGGEAPEGTPRSGAMPEGVLPEAVAVATTGRRQRRQALLVRHFILAHLLHFYHVLEWVGERPPVATSGSSAGRRPLLRFHCGILERDFDVEAITPDPESIEAVRNELKHRLETSSDVLADLG